MTNKTNEIYPGALNKNFFLLEKFKKQIAKDRKEIQDIISGKNDRLIIIVGPCSAWPHDAVIDYAKKLKKISEQVNSFLKIVLRVYTQKPRTISGWNGPLFQPNPCGLIEPTKGMTYASNLMKKILEIGLPIADEALFLEPSMTLAKCLSWVAIGARSSEDQEHRNFASGIGIPVGIKNPTSGSVEIGINSVLAAQSSQISLFYDRKKKTTGNLFAHLVIRGSEKEFGCEKMDLELAIALLKKNKTKNPAVIVDVSHGNCIRKKIKNHNMQISNVQEILKLISKKPELLKYFKGFMIESFIKDGAQDIREKNIDKGGLSITDPCLSWDKTEKLIFEIVENLNKIIKKKG